MTPTAPSLVRIDGAILPLLILVALAASARPAAVAKQTASNLPSSEAIDAFKQFSDQSGTQNMRPSSGVGAVSGRVKNAITGQYLGNARVAIRGTQIVTLTDSLGAYHVRNVTTGALTLEVFHTGLDTYVATVEVKVDDTAIHDIALTSVARYGAAADAIKLDPLIVVSNQEMDAEALAINEQRFAPNIKNVVDVQSFGDGLGSNVGEFLKFIPGLSAEFSGVEVVGISARGLGSGQTTFTTDGATLVTSNEAPSRTVNPNMISLVDVARVEVTKVPTPAMPADSIGGSVNMVTRSAFERSRPQFSYNLNIVGNSEWLTLAKTPHSSGDRNTMKLHPGYNFVWSMPVSRKFGFVLSMMRSDKANAEPDSTLAYSAAGTATGASAAQPYLQQYQLHQAPRSQSRATAGVKLDWRVTQHSVLSFSGEWNYRYRVYTGQMRLIADAGTNGTPTIANGMPLTFGSDFTRGATGRGGITQSGNMQSFAGRSNALSLSYKLDDGKWKIETALSRGTSARSRDNPGHFTNVTSVLSQPARVSMLAVDGIRPGQIAAFSNANSEIDILNIQNYTLQQATQQQYANNSEVDGVRLDVRRRLNLLPFPLAAQIGGRRTTNSIDIKRYSETLTYNGIDGNAATAESPAPYLMQVYRDSAFGFEGIPWVSPNRAWAAAQQDPRLFTSTPAQVVAAETFRINNSQYLEETVSSLYSQGEARLIGGRLNVLTGVRYEKTTTFGRGALVDANAVFLRNPDGTFARNAVGARIRRPDAGAAGSLDELRLVRLEREYIGQREYDGYFPSAHLTLNLSQNLLVRFAYAKTFGRPSFTEIIPSVTINERDLDEAALSDPNIIRGTLTVTNTGLRPWLADNYDLSAEYYSEKGGVISGGIFVKEISDFFVTRVTLATLADVEELGIDPRFVNWNISTRFNEGDARITGAEINIRQSLQGMFKGGQYFSVFLNATRLELKGNRNADFSSFVPKTANVGASFSRKRLMIGVKLNYRGQQQRTAQPGLGADAFEYEVAATRAYFDAAYHLSGKITCFATLSNVFNEPRRLIRHGSETPAYAHARYQADYGVAFAAGLKGSF